MSKTRYSCIECGHRMAKWSGQCPMCQAWNSCEEEQIAARFALPPSRKPIKLSDVEQTSVHRIETDLEEFNRLMGSGVVPGSLTLVGGDPGVGKSTLMLQLSQSFSSRGLLILYISGEESCEQTSLRAKRLGIEADNLLLFSEADLSLIKKQIEEYNPKILIIDSIQIIYKPEVSSSPGSVTQVREVTTELMHLAKKRSMATFVIGHVTKGGEIAGPKILEHLVDTVLYFEGDRQNRQRIIRVVKNRFGPTDEIGVFQMEVKGLEEVKNPSQLLIEQRQKGLSGSCIVPIMEGTRPFLLETQALVAPTGYPTPSRKCAGLDTTRLSLLLAVLEKKVGLQFHQHDVFVSVAGGLKVVEPAIDLAVVLSVASSWKDRPIPPDVVAIGEVGLGGEVRSIPHLTQRVKEAQMLGFKSAIVPKKGVEALQLEGCELELIPVQHVRQALKWVFTQTSQNSTHPS